MNTRTKLSVAAAAFAALLLAACQSNAPAAMKEITTQNAGNLKITLLSEAGELKQGQNQFQMMFHDADGKPVDVGTVTVSCSMSMPGMAPMMAPMEPIHGETGQYSMHGTFGMSGSWLFDVRWDGPAGQGSTSFHTGVR
jgi:outer membrane murein-binding lipoprotein Lpp